MVRVRFEFAVAIGFLILTFGSSVLAGSGPGFPGYQRSEEPLLAAAWKVDFRFQGLEKGDQEKAEKLYLQFVRQHPDSPKVPYIYLCDGPGLADFGRG